MKEKTTCRCFLAFFMVGICFFSVPLFAKTTPEEEALAGSLGNLIAFGTGQVKHGEQIPLPFYQDGKQATRKEARYFVSPNEISTAMVFSQTLPLQGVTQEQTVREKVVSPTGDVSFKNPVTTDVFTLTKTPQAAFQGAVFYIKCSVDAEGIVNISLWKHGWTGQDFNVSQDRSYEELQKYYRDQGITSPGGSEDPQTIIMRKIRETAVANYFVIAMRSTKTNPIKS